MAVTEEQPTATPPGLMSRIDRGIRCVRIAGWTLALGWLCLFVVLVTFGERQGSFADLEESLSAGEIDEVTLTGGLPPDATGLSGVQVRWREGFVLRTATLTNASSERMARDARRDEATPRPVIVGSLEELLTALDSDVRLVQGERRHPPFTGLGYQASGWVGLAYLVLLVGTLMLIAGPRPWRATRWAWAWLVLVAPLFGVPAYLLLGRPTGLFRPAPPRRIWLTGGWAFLLALLLGGTTSN